jgi:GntR family carbon starvation induced transcriptional regulator
MVGTKRAQRKQRSPREVNRPGGERRRAKKDQTLASTALQRLQADIISCRLKPGQRLRFEQLKTEYGLGLSPLREALMRLASEGLVRVEDHRGFRVAPISRSDLLDITSVRKEIEGMAVRLAIELGDDHWEAQILAAYHTLSKWEGRRLKDGLVHPEWEKRHGAFHHALVAACGSPTLLRFRKQLFEHTERYRAASLPLHTMQPRDVLGEHRKLMEAVLDRDVSAAVYLLQEHFGRTTKLLLQAEPTIFAEEDEPPARTRATLALHQKRGKSADLIPQ